MWYYVVSCLNLCQKELHKNYANGRNWEQYLNKNFLSSLCVHMFNNILPLGGISFTFLDSKTRKSATWLSPPFDGYTALCHYSPTLDIKAFSHLAPLRPSLYTTEVPFANLRPLRTLFIFSTRTQRVMVLLVDTVQFGLPSKQSYLHFCNGF